MHAVFVAGQRHDVTQLAQCRQQCLPLRAQTHGIDAQAAGGQFGFADTELGGGIAGAQARLLGAQLLPLLVKLRSGSQGEGWGGHGELLQGHRFAVRANSIGISTRLGTARPSTISGRKRHWVTASRAA
ncbi:hypothetical protein D3C72_1938150 [compost metagenome]